MARVIILSHSAFTHRPSGIFFEPRPILLAEGDKGKRIVGVAEDVPVEVAEAHFSNRSNFRIDYTEAELAAKAEAEAEAAAKAAKAKK